MNRVSRYIHNFLDDHPGMYINRQGVQFFVNNDGSVVVSYVIKDLPDKYSLFGLIYTSNNFNDFIQDFEFAGTKQLKALSPDGLWEMYYKGKAEIYCSIKVKAIYVLFFRREGNKMIVCDDHDAAYELGKVLKTPKQFVEYTRQQAQFH